MEVEAKFRIPDEETFRQLLNAVSVAGFRLGQVSEMQLHDRYLDTTGRVILAAGYACRLRRQGEFYLATLKSLGEAAGAIHRRAEVEVSLPRPLPPNEWPTSAARDLILSLTANEPLVPLFDLEQSRHSRLVYDGERAVAELSLDRVHVPLDEAVVDTSLVLEVEFVTQGRDEDLEGVIAGIEQEWGLEHEPLSKFERSWAILGLGTVTVAEARVETVPGAATQEQAGAGFLLSDEGPGPVELLEAPGIEADDPMSEAGRKTLRFHFRRMLYNEPGTRLGQDIEALHDMRVATRRMRAAFRVFGAFFEPKAVAPYRKGLKRTGRALGRVRDLDVFCEKIHIYLDTLPADQQDSLAALLVAVDVQREAARQQMIAYLDSEKYAHFRQRFGEFVETEGSGSRAIGLHGGKPHPYRARHVAPVSIYERLAAVRAYDDWISVPDPPLERLHELRIACKRLRYTIEYFREILGPDARAIIGDVVEVQDHLGALQDVVVASAILTEFLQWGAWGNIAGQSFPSPVAGGSEPGVEALLAAKQAEMKHLLATFPPLWQRLKAAEFSRMVAETVAVL